MSDPYAEAVTVGLRDALLGGMTAVDPQTGDWRHDWHPRTRRAAFVGVVEERTGDSLILVVLFRVGPRWNALYGWRAVVWEGAPARAAVLAEHPEPDRLVGVLALDLMEGIDGGGWELPDAASEHATWKATTPGAITWVRVPA